MAAPKSRPPEEKPGYYVNVSKGGQFTLSRDLVEALLDEEIDKSNPRQLLLSFFMDVDKRALGIKKVIGWSGEKMPPSYRMIGANKQFQYMVSLVPFLRQINALGYLISKIPVEKYNDTDSMLGVGEVWVAVIPRPPKENPEVPPEVAEVQRVADETFLRDHHGAQKA